MRNALISPAVRREEAGVTAAAMFGILTEGDAIERTLIHEILMEASRTGQRRIYSLAQALRRHQDREDPLHALGHNAVQTWQQTKRNPQGVTTAPEGS